MAGGSEAIKARRRIEASGLIDVELTTSDAIAEHQALNVQLRVRKSQILAMNDSVRFPRVVIEYCPKCKWLLRASYLATEFLETFSETVREISLQPGASGVFTITVYLGPDQSQVLWDRKAAGGFDNQPSIAKLKTVLREIVAPGQNLGHVDRAAFKAAVEPVSAGEP